jgi:cytochrome c
MKFVYGSAAAVVAIAATVGMAAPSTAQNQATGEKTFVMCKGCHTIEKGGRNGIGPNLAGLFGRPAGSIAGYNYSAAMKKSGLRWDEKTLDEFLAAPTKKVPGTKMPIAVADPAKRAALIAYLKSATAD